MPVTSKYEVRISNYAFSNLEEIYHYIAFNDFKPIVASEVVSAIEKKILKEIPSFPKYYPECPARTTKAKTYRQAMCKNYKIIFKLEGKVISIIGIVHSSRSMKFIKKIPLK